MNSSNSRLSLENVRAATQTAPDLYSPGPAPLYGARSSPIIALTVALLPVFDDPATPILIGRWSSRYFAASAVFPIPPGPVMTIGLP